MPNTQKDSERETAEIEEKAKSDSGIGYSDVP